MRKSSWNPATSFREALQSLWFVHLIVQIETNGHSVSLGRIDQYLSPFYVADLEKGAITPEAALGAPAMFLDQDERAHQAQADQ